MGNAVKIAQIQQETEFGVANIQAQSQSDTTAATLATQAEMLLTQTASDMGIKEAELAAQIQQAVLAADTAALQSATQERIALGQQETDRFVAQAEASADVLGEYGKIFDDLLAYAEDKPATEYYYGFESDVSSLDSQIAAFFESAISGMTTSSSAASDLLA